MKRSQPLNHTTLRSGAAPVMTDIERVRSLTQVLASVEPTLEVLRREQDVWAFLRYGCQSNALRRELRKDAGLGDLLEWLMASDARRERAADALVEHLMMVQCPVCHSAVPAQQLIMGIPFDWEGFIKRERSYAASGKHRAYTRIAAPVRRESTNGRQERLIMLRDGRDATQYRSEIKRSAREAVRLGIRLDLISRETEDAVWLAQVANNFEQVLVELKRLSSLTAR